MTLGILAGAVAGMILFWFLVLLGCPIWGCILGGGILAVVVGISGRNLDKKKG